MKTSLSFITVITFLVFGFYTSCGAEEALKDNFLITQDSLGFVKVGTPIKDVLKTAKDLGYTIKKDKISYMMYDKNNMPLLTITVFASHSKTNPVRTIKTTSSKYKLKNDLSLIGSKLSDLEKSYSDASIYRIAPRIEAPEFLDFKNWPFKESVVKGEYILKYKVMLNKLTDEFGKIIPVGIYPTEFSLYTDKYIPEARVESFLIEAIEPKIKFDESKKRKPKSRSK